jgi:hypothetical protein
MNPMNRSVPQRPAEARTHARRTTLSPARRRHASEAVVAAYIHDISTANGHPRPARQSDDGRV